jgi:hypothetical protein
MVIESKEQPWNAYWPIDVSAFPCHIVIDVKPEQAWNAYGPIDVTESGMVIDAKAEQ